MYSVHSVYCVNRLQCTGKYFFFLNWSWTPITHTTNMNICYRWRRKNNNKNNVEYSSVFLLSSFSVWIENCSNKIWLSFNSICCCFFFILNHFIIGVGLHSTVSMIILYQNALYFIAQIIIMYHKTRYVVLKLKHCIFSAYQLAEILFSSFCCCFINWKCDHRHRHISYGV